MPDDPISCMQLKRMDAIDEFPACCPYCVKNQHEDVDGIPVDGMHSIETSQGRDVQLCCRCFEYASTSEIDEALKGREEQA